jgi:hypothetical protein
MPNQREQYGRTVHLFIGTGRNPCKITLMPFTFINNSIVILRGLIWLFIFKSVPLSCYHAEGPQHYLTHRLRIRFPEDKGVRRPKQLDQPRRLTGPARRGSRRGLTTLGAVSAVSAMLPRPRGLAPRLPGGRLGTSAVVGRSRAPQAYFSLGRAVRHRQDFEARNIQAGQ